MNAKPYYFAYENRYKMVYEAGAERWGHSPEDDILFNTLSKWVIDNNLKGKKVIEFACGEGASGVILSQLGCVYHGIDISPLAVQKSKTALAPYQTATVQLLDMVEEQLDGVYDAALDVMGFHMLVTDTDREKYLKNSFNCLAKGAPMLFFRELYKVDAYDGRIETIDEWKQVSGSDYEALHERAATSGDKEIKVYIPLVPGREQSKEGYYREMGKSGFVIDHFVEMELNNMCPHSASIFVHKP